MLSVHNQRCFEKPTMGKIISTGTMGILKVNKIMIIRDHYFVQHWKKIDIYIYNLPAFITTSNDKLCNDL